MTNFERNQSKQTFRDAGRTAFQLGVHVQDNPYKEQPFRGLWEQGFKQAKSKNYKPKFRNNRGRNGQ